MEMLAESEENNTLLKRDAVFAQVRFLLWLGWCAPWLSYSASWLDKFLPWKNEFQLIYLSIQVNFTLQSVSLLLSTDTGGQSILDMECSTVEMGFQSRPRYSAWKFNISVGGLCLKDTYSKDTIFPVLLARQKNVSALNLFVKRIEEKFDVSSHRVEIRWEPNPHNRLNCDWLIVRLTC